jgi:hypothetical protein
MAAEVFTNWGYSLLAGDIDSEVTTLNVSAGTGVRFPTLAGGDWFRALILSETTSNVEVIKVTARTVDQFTIARGFEDIFGATGAGKAFEDGDTIYNAPSAGFFESFATAFNVQSGAMLYAAGSGSNTITASFTPALTAVPTAGAICLVKAAADNTGAVTYNPDGQGAVSVRKPSGGALVELASGDIIQNQMCVLVMGPTYWELTNPAGGQVPISGVIFWPASIASIPSGYLLCDGTSGTPDMRDVFPMGAGNTYAPGDTGGSADAVVIEHNHGGATGNDSPDHTHGLPSTVAFSQTLDGWDSSAAGGTNQGWPLAGQTTVGASVRHTHTIGSEGVSGVGLNLPPFYAGAWIQRV